MNVKCEVCGSSDIIKNGNLFTCQGCGINYSLEEIKSMLASVKNGISQSKKDTKSSESDDLTRLYTLARRAKDEDNADNAKKYYDMILIKDPENWEATFFSEYFKAKNCRIIDIPSAITSLSRSALSAFSLIMENISLKEERLAYCYEIAFKTTDLFSLMLRTKKNHCDELTSDEIKKEALNEFNNISLHAAIVVDEMAQKLSEIEETQEIAVQIWKIAVAFLIGCFKKKANKNDVYIALVRKIMEYDSSYKDPITNETLSDKVAIERKEKFDKLKSKLKTKLEPPAQVLTSTEENDLYETIETWKKSILQAKEEFLSKSAAFSTQEKGEEEFVSLNREPLQKLFHALIPDINNEKKIGKAVQKFLEVGGCFGLAKEDGEKTLLSISEENIKEVSNKGCIYYLCGLFGSAQIIGYIFFGDYNYNWKSLIIAAVAFIIMYVISKSPKRKAKIEDAEIIDQNLKKFLGVNPIEEDKSAKKTETLQKAIQSQTRQQEKQPTPELTRKIETTNKSEHLIARELANKGFSFLKDSDFKKAETYLRQSIKKDPDLPNVIAGV